MLQGQKSENITETHQNMAQKAKITSQKASERVDTVLKGQKSENMTETHQNKDQKSENNNLKNFREGRYCVKGAKKRKYDLNSPK